MKDFDPLTATYFLLPIAIAMAIVPMLLKRRFVTQGEQYFFDQAFGFVQIAGFGNAFFLCFLWLVLDEARLNDHRAFVFVIFMQMLLPFLFLGIPALSAAGKTIELKEIELPQITNIGETTKNPIVAWFVHLSDGHIPSNTTMEGELSRDHAIKRTVDALNNVAAIQKVVGQNLFLFYTGDVTDDGSEDEWRYFNDACAQSGIDRNRLYIVPGNHDTTLETGFSPINRNVTRGFEERCNNFVRAALAECPVSCEYVAGGKTLSVRALLESRRKYLEIYAKSPPQLDIIVMKPASRIYMKPSDAMLECAKSFSDDHVWPKERKPLMSDLIKLIFPIVFFHSPRLLILGLNSSASGSHGIIDGAFGEIDNDQLNKLQFLLQNESKNKARFPNRRVIVLVHHHLGVPARISKYYRENHSSYQSRYLRLKNAKSVLKVLAGHNVIVFHGHKHVSYVAQHEDITIVSGSSLCYGDMAGDANPVSHMLLLHSPCTLAKYDYKPGTIKSAVHMDEAALAAANQNSAIPSSG